MGNEFMYIQTCSSDVYTGKRMKRPNKRKITNTKWRGLVIRL